MNKVQKITAYIVLMWLILGEVTIMPGLIQSYVGVGSMNIANLFIFVLFLIICGSSVRNFKIPITGFINYRIILVLGGFLIFLIIESIDAIYSGSGTKKLLIMICNYYILMVVSFVIIFSHSSLDRGFRFLIRPYIHYSLYIITVGVAAYLLFVFNFANLNDWLFINDYLKKGYEVKGGVYSFPYFMSLFLYGEGIYSLLNIPIIRISGLSFEPNIAALFTAPFLFMIDYYFENRKNIKIYAYVMTSIYILCIQSLTSFMVLAIIFIGYSLKNFKRVFKIIIMVSMIIILLGSMTYIFFEPMISEQSFLITKFDNIPSVISRNISPIISAKNFFGAGMMSDLDTMVFPRGLLGLLYFYLFIFILSLISYSHFYKNSNFNAFSLLILYVIGHSIKSPKHVYFYLCTTYFIIIFAIWIGYYKSILNDRLLNYNNGQEQWL